MLTALPAGDDVARARRGALELVVRIRRDGSEQAPACLGEVHGLVERASGPGARQAACWLISSLFALGRLSEGIALVARWGLDDLSLGNGPRAFWRQSDHMAIDDARALGARLDLGMASMGDYLKLGDVYRRRYAGELRGLDELLDQLVRDARRRGASFVERYSCAQLRHLQMLRGEPPADAGAPWRELPLRRVHALRRRT